jgi:hypothetical protein
MNIKELNIVALENRFEMSATAEEPSIKIGSLEINL